MIKVLQTRFLKRTTVVSLLTGVPLLALLLMTGCMGLRWKADDSVTITNPYEGVDWAAWGRHKGNFHTHTTRSDGKLEPADVIRLYQSKEYGILALTDHETVTYPWTTFGMDPAALDMVAIEGAELYTEAHLNSYFSDITHVMTADTALIEAGARGGLVVLNHPASFTAKSPSWFVELYRKYEHFIGLEAFNGGEQLANGIPYWDLILAELIPSRPVWGFANDDMHEGKQAGFNWNVFLLPELTSVEVRKAMEQGRFFLCSTSGGLDAPVIRSIAVSARDGTITLEADNAGTIRWISAGEVVHEGACLNYRTLPVNLTYVRADLTSPTGGRTCTNPFGLKHGRESKAPRRSDLRKKWEAQRNAIEKKLCADLAANWKRPYLAADGTAAGAWQELDLRPYANRAMTGKNAWIAASYELTQLAPGDHRIHGVPFRVLDQAENDDRAVIALRSRSLTSSGGQDLPDSVSVPVGRRVGALYVLHGAGFVSRHEKAGAYGFVYEDGTSETVDIVGFGKLTSAGELDAMTRQSNIQDWWPVSARQFENERARKVMVMGGSSLGDVRYLYSLQMVNPHPEKTVREIRFHSDANVDTTLLILSATAATLP